MAFPRLRPKNLFFIVELGSRRVVHVGVTRSPNDAWVAQQLREATPFGEGPKYLIHDHDAKFGALFKRAAGGIKLLKTPVHAPKANAICERVRSRVGRRLWVPRDDHYHLVIGQLLPQIAA
jgi:hypothetical protein